MSRDTLDATSGVKVTYNFSAAGADRDGDDRKPVDTASADMSFWDFVDIVNPLQHIPIVNTVYRAITGDTIGSPARVMGGILFGGPVGGVAGIVSAVIADSTGKDPGEHVLSLFDGDAKDAPVQIAESPAEPAERTGPAGSGVVDAGAPAPAALAMPVAATVPAAPTDAAGPPSTSGEGLAQSVADQAVAGQAIPPSSGPRLQNEPSAWPPGGPPPLPPELVADVMKRNLLKYEAQSRAGMAGQRVRIDG